MTAFVHAIASLGNKGAPEQPQFPHIHVGRITIDEKRDDGIGSDMAAIRQLYSNAVSAAQTVWESATVEGMPDVPAALQTVEGLAEAVTQNRTALVALTAMRNYDNYTFTHMVNVSILTMGQARALGIEGRLLREFGLSALMHDIGKVRTPKEILNKPDKLTDEEFVIMRRHTVDGAEILHRRCPILPGGGVRASSAPRRHPPGVRRQWLNAGTMLCSISDIYARCGRSAPIGKASPPSASWRC